MFFGLLGTQDVTGFDHQLAGRSVQVAPDGGFVRHLDLSGNDLDGIAFGNGVLPSFGGSFYFEVCLEEVSTTPGLEDGLTLGIATVLPSSVEDMEVADEVPSSWSFGFDGKAKVDGAELVPIDWQPSSLEAGDHVGLLVSASGELSLIENGLRRAEASEPVPNGVSLYPFVDLLGSAAGVSFVKGAQPPLLFSRHLLSSDFVELTDDGIEAVHLGHAGDAAGVIFCETPATRFGATTYFEVLVEEVRERNQSVDDGLTLGYTIRLPSASELPLEYADDVPEAWCLGFNGQAAGAGLADLVGIPWTPSTLAVGDQVGLLLAAGKVRVCLNGMDTGAVAPGMVPPNMPCYPFIDLLGNTVAVSIVPDAIPPLITQGADEVGFDPQLAASTVQLSWDHLTASRKDVDAMMGLVFTKEPIPAFGSVLYFEVRVDRVIAGQPDGLTLGVTGIRPEGPLQYEFGDEVPCSWSLGYDGRAHVDGQEELQGISWRSSTLHVGDRVGMLVEGSLVRIVCNGADVAKVNAVGIESIGALWPFIDLLGNTVAVTLFVGAAPPAQHLDGINGFAKKAAGRSLAVSADGLTARHTSPGSGELDAVAFSEQPMPRFGSLCYFEVSVDSVTQGDADGLTIGVSSVKPDPSLLPIAAADEVPSSWSIGYNGQMYSRPNDKWMPSRWQPSRLKVGDCVGLLITPLGELSVLQNGEEQARLDEEVPLTAPLYPFVDLLGNTVQVSIVPGAPPPPPMMAPKRGFDRDFASRYVEIGPDGLTATHKDPSGDALNGVVFTADVIETFGDNHAYFEVEVLKVREHQMDGLTLGVTSAMPSLSFSPLETADDVPSSWSVGYDGSAHVDGKAEMVPVDWDASTLRVGDHVGLLISNDGQLCVVENGSIKVTVPTRIPTTVPLYPFIDLLGAARAVLLRVDAIPSPVALAAVEKQKPAPPSNQVRLKQEPPKSTALDSRASPCPMTFPRQTRQELEAELLRRYPWKGSPEGAKKAATTGELYGLRDGIDRLQGQIQRKEILEISEALLNVEKQLRMAFPAG